MANPLTDDIPALVARFTDYAVGLRVGNLPSRITSHEAEEVAAALSRLSRALAEAQESDAESLAMYYRARDRAEELSRALAERDAELVTLRKSRGVFCNWCLESIDLSGLTAQQCIDRMAEHQFSCPDDPRRETIATLTSQRDEARAALAEQAKHDCDEWLSEGMGCALCNDTAIALRETWANDPVRKERDELRAALARYEANDRRIRTGLPSGSGPW